MTYSITVKKSGTKFDIDFEAMPEVSKQYIIQRGLDHLQDVHAGIHLKTKNAEGELIYPDMEEVGVAANAVMERKLESLRNGVVTIRSAGKAPINPVDKIAYNLAKKDVVRAIKAQGHAIKSIAKDKLHELVSNLVESNDKYLIDANVQYDIEQERLKTLDVEIDLGDLI